MPIKRQKEYAQLLAQLGGYIVEAADIMKDASTAASFTDTSSRLHEVAQQSDNVAKRIFELLDTAPDLPSWVEDRWDFVTFAHGLDNLVDLLEEIVTWGEAFGLSPAKLNIVYDGKEDIAAKVEPRVALSGTVFEDFSRLMLVAASMTRDAIPMLDKMGKREDREALNTYIVAISALEQAGDKLWKKAMSALLSKAPESWKEVEERRHVERLFDRFEATFDEFKKVSLSIKAMMLKNA